MAKYEVEFWNGDITEVEGDSLQDAKENAEGENPGIGVKKAVLIGSNDKDDEDENPEDDEEDEDDDDEDDDVE